MPKGIYPIEKRRGLFKKGHPSYITDESKKKISQSLKGKLPKNIETLKKYWLGKKRPEMNGNRWNFGRSRTEEFKQSQRNRMLGDKSPLWKGGRMKNYPELVKVRKSIEYKEWRRNVFKRDNWTCQHCGYKGEDIEADHIKPFISFPELRLDVGNGRTLCKSCHKKVTFKKPTYAFNFV